MGLEFGEAALWKRRPEGGHLGKLTSLWNDRICLGSKAGAGKIVVANKDGIWETRAVQCMPSETRWLSENARTVIGVPWREIDDDPNADWEAIEGRTIDPISGEILKEDSQKAEEASRETIQKKTEMDAAKTDEGMAEKTKRGGGETAEDKNVAKKGREEGARQAAEISRAEVGVDVGELTLAASRGPRSTSGAWTTSPAKSWTSRRRRMPGMRRWSS